MATMFGSLDDTDRKNGWTEASWQRYLEQRALASNLVAGFVPTETVRPRPPVRIETIANYDPYEWSRS